MPEIAFYIPLLFTGTVLLTLYFFYRAVHGNTLFLPIACMWLVFQAALAYSGFYTDTTSVPPRFPLLIAPAILAILVIFSIKTGRRFADSLNLEQLTMLHVVRIPVEIVLYLLFVDKAVPQIMTFEGLNFDILSGITAPVVLYLYKKKIIGSSFLLIWNIVCLLLLVNIVTIAVLSAPMPFQKFGFGQPNLALAYFPYIWLPCCVVPLVLFSHLAVIRHLTTKKHSS